MASRASASSCRARSGEGMPRAPQASDPRRRRGHGGDDAEGPARTGLDVHRHGMLRPLLPGVPARGHQRHRQPGAEQPPQGTGVDLDPAGRSDAAKPRSIPVGKGIALLQIPRIKVEQVVVQGVERADLKKGPGHVPSTVMPGQAGTFGVSGHRTTYGGPFFRLNELTKGDIMTVVTKDSVFTYQVTSKKLVLPSDVSVLDNVRGPGGKVEPTITLTTCHPRFSAKQRLIVFGNLVATVPNNGTVAA